MATPASIGPDHQDGWVQIGPVQSNWAHIISMFAGPLCALLLVVTIMSCCCRFLVRKLDRANRRRLRRQNSSSLSSTSSLQPVSKLRQFGHAMYSLWFLAENGVFLLFSLCVQTWFALLVGFHSHIVQYYGLALCIVGSLIFMFFAVLHSCRLQSPKRSKVAAEVLETRTPVEQTEAMEHKVVIVEGSNSDDEDDDLEKEVEDINPTAESPQHPDVPVLPVNVVPETEGDQLQSIPATPHPVSPLKPLERKNSKLSNKTSCGRFWARETYLRAVIGALVNKGAHGVALYLTLFLCLLVTVLIYILLFGTCLCFQPDQWTSMLTRAFEPPFCKPGSVCHCYLTLVDDVETPNSMMVKFHTFDIPQYSYVLYGTSSSSLTLRQNCTMIDFGSLAMNSVYETRIVHNCLLSGLAADTKYWFQPVYETTNGTILDSNVRFFKTMHADTSRPVKFVVGGDIALHSVGFNLFNVAANQDPDFILIGGDIAYDNGQPTCMRTRWDQTLQLISLRSNIDNRTIPILTTIGNHEALYSTFSMRPYDALPYLHLFTHRNTSSIITNEAVIHHHVFGGGHTSMTILDSGVILPHCSNTQIDFMRTKLTASNARNKLVAYHGGLYPSYRDPNATLPERGKKCWESIFNSANVSVAFEHHDHMFKRTKPIRNNQIVDHGGVTYLGDGSLGADSLPDEVRVPWTPEEQPYLLKSAATPHVWVVTSTSTGATYRALDQNGVEFDSITL